MLAYLIFKGFKFDRAFLIGMASLIGILGLGRIFNYTPRGDFLDFILPSSIYIVYCYLAYHLQGLKPKLLRVVALILAFFPVGIGYLISTIGFFGILLISSDLEPNKSVDIGQNSYYREYGYGNATSSDGGLKIDLYTYLTWFPIIEKRIYSKQISTSEYNTESLRVALHKISENFNIKIYSKDSLQIDTLVDK